MRLETSPLELQLSTTALLSDISLVILAVPLFRAQRIVLASGN